MEEIIKTNKIRLSVIDDHPIIFYGIEMAIKKCKANGIHFINRYSSGKDILNNLNNLKSDVLLVDMCLPDIKGYELIGKILELYPKMKIGMYSNMLHTDDILNSFRYGAIGYLSKSSNAEEIIDFIYTIAKGDKYIRGEVADILFSQQIIDESNKKTIITKRENEILQLILDGFKNREIADKLSIAERTVEFHKQNIYLKLEVNNSVDLVKKAFRSNLVPTNDLWS